MAPRYFLGGRSTFIASCMTGCGMRSRIARAEFATWVRAGVPRPNIRFSGPAGRFKIDVQRRIAVRSAQRVGDHHPMDLAGAFKDRVQLGIPVPLLTEWSVM